MSSVFPIASDRMLFRVPELAGLLGISAARVWRGVWAGRIESVRFGQDGSVRVSRAEVQRLLAEKREKKPAHA